MKKAITAVIICLFSMLFIFACGEDDPPVVNEKTYTQEEIDAAVESLVFLPTISYDFSMPKLPESYEGVTLAYISDKPQNISVEGIVVRELEDVAVKITATVSWKDLSAKKDFNITVRARTRTDREKVEYVYEHLDIEGLSNITANLTLPLQDANSFANLTWLSNHPYISNTGVVTRPDYPSQDFSGKIYALIESGGEQRIKTFLCTVLAKDLTSVKLNVENIAYSLTLNESGKAVLSLTGKAYRIKIGTVKKISLIIESENKRIEVDNLLDNKSGYDEGEFDFNYIFGDMNDLISGENATFTLVSQEENDRTTAIGYYLISGESAFTVSTVETETARYELFSVTDNDKEILKITKTNFADFYFQHTKIVENVFMVKGEGEINQATSTNSRYRVFKLVLTAADGQSEKIFNNIVMEGGKQFEFAVDLSEINLADYKIEVTIKESAGDGIYNYDSCEIKHNTVTGL